MTEQEQLFMARGVIASLSPEQQAEAHKVAEKIRAAIKEGGEVGLIAFALVGLEMQQADNKGGS